MGDVVSLPIRKKFTRTSGAEIDAAPAQIMFFTGVRYQRMTEASPENDGAQPSSEGGMGGKRRRKRG